MWISRTKFIELNAPQRSNEWYRARKRITASTYESVLGLSMFTEQEEAINRILGFLPPKEDNPDMQAGRENEGPFRDWYSKQFNVKITEPSLCIPLTFYDFPMRWNKYRLLSEIYPKQYEYFLHPNWFIGGSPDGEIYYQDGSEANLEIKSVRYMYKPLADYIRDKEFGFYKFKPRFVEYNDDVLTLPYKDIIKKYGFEKRGIIDNYPHIWQSHFMQMQGCMAILRKQQCVYLVGCSYRIYTETIYFDESYWRYFLFPSLVDVIENKLKPKLTDEFKKDFNEEIKCMLSCENLNFGIIPFNI
ncbi:MAG: hypothetical protein QW478_00690 [Candidatus Micrarchaeaceae archaeon]